MMMMTIDIEHEDVEELAKWGMGLEKLIERCVFCKTPTRHWHNGTNNPICPDCAATHNVEDIPK